MLAVARGDLWMAMAQGWPLLALNGSEKLTPPFVLVPL